MPWLYEHRHQLDGMQFLAEIAHWAVIFHVPPEDRDDVEQEIVIELMQTVEKHGNRGRNYLKAVAWGRICRYLRKKYKERRRLHYIFEGDKGEMVGGMWEFLHDGDADARLDAKATLATLPKRLIQIGYKLLNGEKLSEADQHYWVRQKAKLRPELNCRRYANRLSDWEKRRILQLNSKDLSMYKIARTVGRSNKAVMRVLAGRQLSRQNWLAKMEKAAKERDERIRYAYFVEGKGTSQIAREFHHSLGTVRKAIRAGQASKR